MKVSTDDLSDVIMKELMDYSSDITDGVKDAVDVVSKEVNQTIKDHISFKSYTGEYIKSFRISKTYEDGYKKVNKWNVINGQYRLTHLLEYGHALPQGGRSAAYSHIKYGEEIATKRMEELAKEAIEKANNN